MKFTFWSSGVIDQFFILALEATVFASVLIALIAAVQWLFGKRLGPGWRFILWSIVLVRLLLPALPESRLSLFNLTTPSPQFSQFVPSIPLPPPNFSLEEIPTVEQGRGVQFPAPVPASTLSVSTVDQSVPAVGSTTTTVPASEPIRSFSMLAYLWFIGATAFLGRLILGSMWFSLRLRSGLTSDHSRLYSILNHASADLRTNLRPQIIETNLVLSPALFGLFRPKLLVPVDFAGNLSDSELRHVFLHELAHLKRRDLLTNWLMALAHAIHWFNPLVWMAFRQMRVERELACDEMALRVACNTSAAPDESRAYGETILRLLEGISSRRTLPGLVGIAEEKHSIRKRIVQIATFDRSFRAFRTLALALVCITGICGLTNAQIKKTETEKVPSPDAAAPSSSAIIAQPLKSVGATDSVEDISRAPGVLVNDARLLMEMGKLDEAESKLRLALKLDPEKRAAYYYLNLVEERRLAPKPEIREPDVIFPTIPPTTANPYARTNRTYTSPGRQALVKRLNDIIIDRYEVPGGLELSEVIKDLYRIARDRDPDKKGVNFVISSLLDKPRGAGPGFDPASIDPLTGQPLAIPNRQTVRLEDYKVTIEPPLRDVRLIDILQVITHVAIPPHGAGTAPGLAFSLEDYGIVFSQRSNESEPLFTRTFKVDPNTFIQGLDGVFANPVNQQGAPMNKPSLHESIRNFFIAAGVDFGTNQFTKIADEPMRPQKAIFFNDRTGVLFVRATLRELDLVEAALQALNLTPPQVNIRSEVIELKTRKDLDSIVGLLKKIQGGELRPALTDPEFRRFRNELEKGPLATDFALVKLPQVTTLSGRTARVGRENLASIDVTPHYTERNNSFQISASVVSFRLSASGVNPPSGNITLQRRGRIYDGQVFILLPETKEGALIPSQITFITAELIDPAGNRIHSAEASPLENERIPPQELDRE